MRPQSIIKFDQLYFATLALGLVGLALNYQATIAQFEADVPSSGMRSAGPVLLLGAYAVGVLISLLLWFFASRRASSTARVIIAVLTGLGLVTLPFSLMELPLPALVLAVVSAAVQIAMLWFLFRPDAAAWFAHGPRGLDANVFE